MFTLRNTVIGCGIILLLVIFVMAVRSGNSDNEFIEDVDNLPVDDEEDCGACASEGTMGELKSVLKDKSKDKRNVKSVRFIV